MDREGFRNRLKQYKEAKGFDPQLKYWEWKQKYDSAPQPDDLPSQPEPDKPTTTSSQLEDRAHRWDNGYVNTNRESFDSPYEDARYHDYRKPRFELRKGDVHYGNPKLLNVMGKFGKVLRGGSVIGEIVQNLFPSEEAEAIESLRVNMQKQNDYLTGKDIPKYDEGTDGVIGPPTEEQWYVDITKYNPTILDNASMYWSIEQAKKDLHAQAMGLPGYAPMWNEYMRTLPKDDPDINEFVDQLWEYENPDNIGYNSAKKKYYPHKSPEGGKMTIGPGFKLGSGSHNITEREAKRGVTKARLNQEARRSGNNYFKVVDKALNKGQTANPADTVSKQMKYGLADILHQTGSLDNWPKLLNAVRNGDLENIKKESIVTWKDSSGKVHEDVRRNNLRNENNWHY